MKKLHPESLLKVVFEAVLRLREETVHVGTNSGPQMLN